MAGTDNDHEPAPAHAAGAMACRLCPCLHGLGSSSWLGRHGLHSSRASPGWCACIACRGRAWLSSGARRPIQIGIWLTLLIVYLINLSHCRNQISIAVCQPGDRCSLLADSLDQLAYLVITHGQLPIHAACLCLHCIDQASPGLPWRTQPHPASQCLCSRALGSQPVGMQEGCDRSCWFYRSSECLRSQSPTAAGWAVPAHSLSCSASRRSCLACSSFRSD